VDCNGSELSQIVGFGISSVEPLSSVTAPYLTHRGLQPGDSSAAYSSSGFSTTSCSITSVSQFFHLVFKS
jgi:hypothetical protein